MEKEKLGWVSSRDRAKVEKMAGCSVQTVSSFKIHGAELRII
jgi:hypothetical protein